MVLVVQYFTTNECIECIETVAIIIDLKITKLTSPITIYLLEERDKSITSKTFSSGSKSK
jgi:hypothetical protein